MVHLRKGESMDNPNNNYEFLNVNHSNFSGMKNYLEVYEEFGVVVFRKFFNKDSIFTDFYNDVKMLSAIIIDKHNLNIDLNNSLNRILTEISLTNREEISAIYDLGTRPLKLLNGNRMKTHPLLVEMVKTIFGRKSIVASPYLGDTLHIFPPGKENFKYNLPMHQDYPYLLQSPEQITLYINLGELQKANNGGIKIWPGSHREGISPSTLLENKLRITTNADYFRDNYPEVDIVFDVGDLAIFNSLLQHEGIQNKTACTRIVQLMRYSNLANDLSTSYSWSSCEGTNRGVQFSDIHD